MHSNICQLARDGALHRMKRVQRLYPREDWHLVINRFNSDGYTPLHLAASNNRKCFVDYLLNMGADIEAAESNNQNTPLLLAAKYAFSNQISYYKCVSVKFNFQYTLSFLDSWFNYKTVLLMWFILFAICSRNFLKNAPSCT